MIIDQLYFVEQELESKQGNIDNFDTEKLNALVLKILKKKEKKDKLLEN